MEIFNTHRNEKNSFPEGTGQVCIPRRIGAGRGNFIQIKKTWIVVLISVVMLSCSRDLPEDAAVVTGIVSGYGGELARLEELKTQRIIPVDSVKLDKKGGFTLEVLPEETGFFLLRLAKRDPVFLILGKQDTIRLDLDTADFDLTYEVNGNKSSRMMMEYHMKTGETKKEIDALRKVLFEKQGEPDFAEIKFDIDTTLDSALMQHREFTGQLIRDNPGELASLLLINQTLAGQPVFNTAEDADLYFMIEDSLSAKYPENSHVKSHISRMERLRESRSALGEAAARVGIGKKVPGIKLPDINGKPVSISSLRGNPVILFFWASWSPESRADLQLLKKLYNHNQNTGLEIFAVSLDHNKKFWKAAVSTEKLPWVNVCDAAGLQGATAKLFHIRNKLPYYFLIDKSGTIISKTDDFAVLENALKDFTGSMPDLSGE